MLMNAKMRKRGGVILHIVVCLLCSLGQAVVCEEFFVPAVEKMATAMKLSPDVAGASSLAIGSSAPELGTALVSVLVAKSDLATSGMVGSAVFNLTAVLALCTFAIGPAVRHRAPAIDKWPFCRDITAYTLAVVALVFVMFDSIIEWYEALSMMFIYIFYCLFLWKNPQIENWVNKCCSRNSPNDFEEEVLTGSNRTSSAAPADQAQPKSLLEILKGLNANKEESMMIERLCLRIPYLIVYPICALGKLILLDISRERSPQVYVYNFIVSLVWLGAFSYLTVWMITVIGATLGIPDTVMGLTFIAAGTSLPDALSSYTVAKEGFHMMGISNAVGSNIFDMLVALGAPWLLETAVVRPGSKIQLYSKGQVYSVALLIFVIFFVLLSTVVFRWKMTWKLGVTLLIVYSIFTTIFILIENNVFGFVNPPICPGNF